MRTVASVTEEGRLKVVIETCDAVERWFLRQLMEHGASVVQEDDGCWTNIVLMGRSPEEAELAGFDELLGDG